MADVLTGRYHFGSGINFGFSRPVKSALGFPDPVQGIHSSGLGSMSPPILGVGGFDPRTTLGLGGGGTLMVGGGPPLCAAGEVGSPVLRDWGVDPVSVMTYGLYALDGGSQTLYTVLWTMFFRKVACLASGAMLLCAVRASPDWKRSAG